MTGFELSILDTSLLVMLVFFAGFVDSIAGGGGIISLPAYFAFGLPPHNALATNKFSSFLGTSTSVIRYYKAGKISLKVGLLAAIGAVAGSIAGARIALALSANQVSSIMMVLVPLVLISFLFKNKIFPSKVATDKILYKGTKGFLIGLVIGCYDGFFGPGTGAFLAIGFNMFLRFDLLQASATARMGNMASNAGALVTFLIGGKVLFPLAFFCAIGGISGNILGSRLALKKGEKVIKPLMILVLLLLMLEVIRQHFYT